MHSGWHGRVKHNSSSHKISLLKSYNLINAPGLWFFFSFGLGCLGIWQQPTFEARHFYIFLLCRLYDSKHFYVSTAYAICYSRIRLWARKASNFPYRYLSFSISFYHSLPISFSLCDENKREIKSIIIANVVDNLSNIMLIRFLSSSIICMSWQYGTKY